jgi:hypothetical protein
MQINKLTSASSRPPAYMAGFRVYFSYIAVPSRGCQYRPPPGASPSSAPCSRADSEDSDDEALDGLLTDGRPRPDVNPGDLSGAGGRHGAAKKPATVTADAATSAGAAAASGGSDDSGGSGGE